MSQPADAFVSQRTGARSTTWPLVVITVLSVLIALLSLRYLAFPRLDPPSVIAGNVFRDPWLILHVAGAASALLLGPAQFFPSLRARYLRLHRWTGRFYVGACMLGSVSGFVLALGASTGWISSVGFGTLAVAWLVTTALAYIRVVQGRLDAHRQWMVRSFALTLAAVTLRLYLPIGGLLPWPFLDSYRAISFLCWLPNLLAAELFLSSMRQRMAGRAA